MGGAVWAPHRPGGSREPRLRFVRRVVLLLWLLLGCAGDADVVSVFAASSLTDAFADLERAYEATHPGVDLQVTHAGSQVLRLQIEQGAGADVFVSADARHVEALRGGGLAGQAVAIATNELVIGVPLDDRVGIREFADLDRAGRIVVGTADVPVGAYTRQVLTTAEQTHGAAFVYAVRARVVSEESNVRLVRAKVALGEADAAFLYRTDTVSGAVRAVELPSELRVRATYVAAPVARPGRTDHASRDAFLAWLRGPEARTVLEGGGFGAP